MKLSVLDEEENPRQWDIPGNSICILPAQSRILSLASSQNLLIFEFYPHSLCNLVPKDWLSDEHEMLEFYGIPDSLLLLLAHDITNSLHEPQPVEWIEATMTVIGRHIIRRYSAYQPEDVKPQSISKVSCEKIKKAMLILNQSECQPISTEAIASMINMSPFHFIRVFRKATGLTPARYQVFLRLKKAETLLLQTKNPLADIALDTGFSSQAHFSVAFKKYSGLTPQQFRINQSAVS